VLFCAEWLEDCRQIFLSAFLTIPLFLGGEFAGKNMATSYFHKKHEKNVMRKIVYLIFVISILSCGPEVEIFKGDIVVLEEPAISDQLSGGELQFAESLQKVGRGSLCVYDSLIFLSADSLSGYCFFVYNTKTGELVDSIARKGIGANEFISASYSEQYHADSSGICLWFYDYEKSECSLVDLSNNFSQKQIGLSALENEREYPFGRIFVLNDSLLLAFSQGEDLYHNRNLSPPLYHIFNYRTNEELTKYEFYNGFSYSKKLAPQMCLYSQDRLKPDRRKLAMGMRYLRQINIMDVETGKIRGYQVKGSPDFNILTKRSAKYHSYYLWLCVDDDFIYGALNSKDEKNTAVDVFDWDGNFRKKLILDKKMSNINSIALDPVNKYLYVLTIENEKEKIFRYDVNYLYSKA
jgi:hypothetical protein